MKKLTKGSFWLSIFEQLVYVCPTLGTILYYYFSELEQSLSAPSKMSFTLAVVLFVLFLTYKAVAKTKIAELRQSVVQSETDLRNEPARNVEKRLLLASNAKSDRLKLDMYDRGMMLITLIIIALGIRILEQAMIGLTNLAYIACGSVIAGFCIHIGVLSLRKHEAIKGGKE